MSVDLEDKLAAMGIMNAPAYAKKFAKFEKSVRKAWAKSPDLKDPYVLPDAGAVDALVDRWRGPGA